MFRDNSLRSRLTTLVIVAIFGAVTIVTVSSVWRETSQYTEKQEVDLRTVGAVYAAAIAEDISAGDSDAALKTLQRVAQQSDDSYIEVLSPDNKHIIDIGSMDGLSSSSGASDNLLNQWQHLVAIVTTTVRSTSVPIVHNDLVVGHVRLHAQTDSLFGRIGLLIYDSFVAAIFAAGIGILIALKMQRTITDPIIELANSMDEVRKTGDFSNRANVSADDETGKLVASFNDMLDQLQERDMRLQSHQKNLKKIVHRRTEEMQRAKEIAEAASVAKSEFLATMSHEIRTPLNGLLVMADLLNKTSLPPRQKRYSDVIAKSGHSLLAIINDILDFSKIEAGRLVIEDIPLRPSECIDDVINLFWERAVAKGVDLAGYVAPNVPETITGDPVRLNQILSNLVNNALKFTESGHVIVSVKRIPTSTHECMLEFSVEDSGIGITEEQQERIFEAFSQADQSTTRKFGGTGLGLAICRSLVDAMGGAIDVSSELKKGSKFKFRFDTKIVAAAKPWPEANEKTHAVISIDGTATPTILARYLSEAGVTTQIIESDDFVGSHIAYADMIFAAPAFLDQFSKAVTGEENQWIPARVCVCELGDTAADRLLETGDAEDLMLAPVSRRDTYDQLHRVFNGKLRGQTATTSLERNRTKINAFKKQRILAADDSIINREVVREALTKLNLEPTLVADGAEAVKAFMREPFDLILMDCSMPVMDGYEATRAIRKFETKREQQKIPIVALTAHVAGDDNTWQEVGMSEYVTKPFTIQSLATAISKFIEPEDEFCKFDEPTTSEELDKIAAPTSEADPIAIAAPIDRPSRSADIPTEKTVAEAHDESPFDTAVLDSLAQMGSSSTDIVSRALGLFQKHAPEALINLVKAAKAADNKQIGKAAHALKSMSLNVGATKLGQSLGNIERIANDGAPIEDITPAIREASKHYKKVQEALPQVLQEYANKAA